MKRRKFIQSTAVASTLPLAVGASAKGTTMSQPNEGKELYELRTYELHFRINQKLLIDYLTQVLKPALERIGAVNMMLFSEMGQSDPRKIWVLLSYPSSDIYIQAQNLQKDAEYVAAAKIYDAIQPDKPAYTRFKSSLLLAFGGMPKMLNPIEGAALFELRIYEGYSEDAVRRKIKMFDEEEITLFHKVGLHPVFFGDMLAGPHRPCLVYMLNFTDMEQRNAHWGEFLKHPDWNEMVAKPEYANTLSNIRKIFLEPIS